MTTDWGIPKMKTYPVLRTVTPLSNDVITAERLFDIPSYGVYRLGAPSITIAVPTIPYVERRIAGEFEGRAFFLSEGEWDWELGKDSDGAIVLVPVKR